jgi:hypothetical protein
MELQKWRKQTKISELFWDFLEIATQKIVSSVLAA